MATCLTCKTEFLGGEQFCPKDGTPLQAPTGGDRLLGRLLSGRYRLESRLGQGGMGAVYRAHHILMDKAVAVKVLRHELSSDAEAVARFHREARSASRLDHDHIIRVTDFGQSDDGQLFLVMELLDGESLAEVIHKGPLPWRRAAQVMRDAALGLAHAHEQGIIHRDLKPENIILARRPKSNRQLVKVLDFGLAKLMHEAGAVPDASITRTGVVFGTPEYMSPEQAEGASLDHRTDLYALGVVAYQMVTGDVPFSAATFLALITKTVQEAPVPPSVRCPGLELPAELEALIMRLLEKKPADRPQSAEEVVDAVELLLALQHGGQSAERSLPLREPSGLLSVGDTPRSPAASATTPRPESGAPEGTRGELERPTPVPDSGRRPPRETPPAESAQPAAFAVTLGAASAPPLAVAQEATLLTPADAAPAPASEADAAPAPTSEADAAPDEPLEEEPLRPGRRRWPWAVAAVALLGAGAALAPRLLVRPETPAAQPAGRDPLAAAQELLQEHRPDEALALLQGERQRRNSAALQRLLSEAYEAKNNRLKALGHMYLALALAREGGEDKPTRMRFAQLLSHLGYRDESCRAVGTLLGEAPPAPLLQQAESLVRTLRCPRRQ